MAIKTFTTGEVLTASDTNTYLANSGLVYVTDAAFTGVTSVSMPANTFTTTYKNFRVVLQVTASSGVTNITMRFRASGTDDANNIYRQTTLGVLSTGTTNNFLGDRTDFGFGSITNVTGGFLYSVFDVNDMATNSIKAIGGQTMYNNGTNHSGAYTQGQLSSAKTFDSMSFIASGGYTITGRYFVYGYRNS
jgi:hypothetical protein